MIFFNEILEKINDEKYFSDEVDRLEVFLYGKSESDKSHIIENVTDDLLNGYYLERSKSKTKGKPNDIKPMLAYQCAALSVIYHICRRLSYQYSKDFVNGWAKRTEGNYFPFGEMMREPEPQQIGIPEELQTDEAKAIFAKAIKAGLMESTKTGLYQWKKSTALLAYMCGRLYCGDKIVKDIAGDDVIQRGCDYFPETDLNRLFQTKNLGQSHQQLKNKRPPRGHECVDDLF
jgi:hypothetical protein